MIYVTSDPHFYHGNIIKYKNRPFSGFWEMNAVMADNWNRTVGADDEVYILGDLTLRDGEIAEQTLEGLHGRKYLVRGNHDYFAADYRGKSLEWAKDYHELTVGNDLFVLCHYPFAEWNRQRRGAYHLHGHQHNHSDYNLRQRREGLRRYDVGVDANGFAPVPLEKIVRFFA